MRWMKGLCCLPCLMLREPCLFGRISQTGGIKICCLFVERPFTQGMGERLATLRAAPGATPTFFSAPLCSASKNLDEKQARYTRAFLRSISSRNALRFWGPGELRSPRTFGQATGGKASGGWAQPPSAFSLILTVSIPYATTFIYLPRARQAMPETTHVDRIFSLLTQQDEITWQTILYDLVRKEGMDPWDVDISLIARRYIELIRKLKEHDFRLSGKVLLAAAILLKLKSSKLVDEDITELDRLIRGEEEGTSDDLLFEEPGAYRREELGDISLMPRTPQPRKRKVSIFDLVKALEKALEVKHRRVHNQMPAQPLAPHKKSRDITELIREG